MRRLFALATLPSLAATVLLAGGSALAKPDPKKERLDKAIATLERGVKAGDFDVRALAIEGLGFAPKGRGAALVKDALADPQWKVRAAAITALRAMKDGTWEVEVKKSVCDMAVDPELGILPLVEPLGPKGAVPIILKGLEAKDCPRPDRYVSLFIARGGEWLTTSFLAAPKASKEVAEAFARELPKLPLPAGVAVYKAGFAKYPADLQKALVQRFATAPEGSVDDVSFIKPILKSKDAEALYWSSVLLARRGDAAGRATLVEALSNPDEAKRKTALEALVKVADAGVHEKMKALIKDPESSYETLVLAYTVYAGSSSTKLATYLEGQLESTDVPQRAAAVYFLGKVKGRAALVDLHPIIANAPKTIKLAACNAIGELAQRESIPVLRDALQRETDKDLKLAELKALAAIKDAEIIPVARFYITDRDPDIRRAAIEALIAVPDATSAADLEIVAERELQKDVREGALFALIGQDPENRLMLFTKSLEWLAPESLATFVKQHGDKVKRHVLAALASPRDDLRSTAWTLTRGLSKAVQLEIATELATRAERQGLRIAALDRIVELQGKQAIPTLEAFVRDPDDKVRVAAIASLGRLGDKAGLEALAANLDDPSERVRVAVAGVIVKL